MLITDSDAAELKAHRGEPEIEWTPKKFCGTYDEERADEFPHASQPPP
ncbi:MAG: hypothetical protein ABJB22_01765 [Verrucomicrobiota bacterium]